MELLIQVLVAVLGGLIVYLIGYIVYGWWTRWTRRICIRRITSPGDRNLEQMCELHDKSFPKKDVKDSCDNIIRWLEEMESVRRGGKSDFEEYLLVAEIGSDVVGYLLAQYYPKYFFISYLAVGKEHNATNKKEAAEKLIKKLLKLARANHPGFRGLVAELEEDKAEEQMRRFRMLAKKVCFRAYEVCTPYKQPRLLPTTDLPPIPQSLLFFPGDNRDVGETLTKEEVLEMIRFIYLDVYGDSYKDDPEEDEEYRGYLTGLYNEYKNTLSEYIPVRSLEKRRRVSA